MKPRHHVMLPENLDVAVLEALRRFFSDEGTAEPQSLDFEGFCAAFGEAMGTEEDGAGRASHDNLRQLFMRIDANSDGIVDWEFSNFSSPRPSPRTNTAPSRATERRRRCARAMHTSSPQARPPLGLRLRDAITAITTITRPSRRT